MTLVSFARTETNRRDLESLRDGFGPVAWKALTDPDVTDVLLNGNGSLFEDRQGAGLVRIGSMDDYAAQSVINLIASIAGETIKREALVTEAELPLRNARFIGYSPPLTAKPSFAIRLPPNKIYTLADYVEAGIATPDQAAVLEAAVQQEKNILVSGGTKSGKSTLLNALLEAMHRLHPAKRIGLIEEIVELQYLQTNVLALRTGTHTDHQDMLKRLMRSRPDYIVFGEVRDKAALQLINAGNTGHGVVMSTVHANTPHRA